MKAGCELHDRLAQPTMMTLAVGDYVRFGSEADISASAPCTDFKRHFFLATT